MAGGSLLTPISIDSTSAQISWATRLRHTLGVDRAVAFTVLARGWSALALYLRTHKQEKFMINSIAGALWMGPATLLLGRSYGAYGIVIGYLCGSLVIGSGFGFYTFMKWRRIWHAG
jgi:hypothetical protein